jgi:hypothetical protein
MYAPADLYTYSKAIIDLQSDDPIDCRNAIDSIKQIDGKTLRCSNAFYIRAMIAADRRGKIDAKLNSVLISKVHQNTIANSDPESKDPICDFACESSTRIKSARPADRLPVVRYCLEQLNPSITSTQAISSTNENPDSSTSQSV